MKKIKYIVIAGSSGGHILPALAYINYLSLMKDPNNILFITNEIGKKYLGIIESNKINIPFSLSYTLTNAKFLTDFGSTQDIWGEVSNGDRIPYIPQHQLNSSISFEANKFELNLNANYNGKFSTVADGSIEIPSYLIFDVSFKYKLRSDITLKSKILNLFDNKYAVSRAPAGLRPGHPFGIYTGFEYKF